MTPPIIRASEKVMEYRSIGAIHTPFESPEGMPIQPAGTAGMTVARCCDSNLFFFSDVSKYHRYETELPAPPNGWSRCGQVGPLVRAL